MSSLFLSVITPNKMIDSDTQIFILIIIRINFTL